VDRVLKDRFAGDGPSDVDKVQYGIHRPSALRVTIVFMFIDIMRGEARRIKG